MAAGENGRVERERNGGEVKERREGRIANVYLTGRNLLTAGDWKELQM